MLLNYKRTMPIKNNHINVNVKNVIKLDHNKKKTRRRRKNKNNKNIPIPLARPNNSVYNPNAITYQTGGGGGGSIQYSANKPTYDMKPRIGFGIDPNSDTTSTNMTQQLLLEHQKKNDDKTNQMFLEYQNNNEDLTNQRFLDYQNMNDDRTNKMFLAYHTNFVNGMKLYHNNYYEPLKNDIHILKSDFDSYKNTYPIIYEPHSPLPERYTNDFLINNDDNNAVIEYNNEPEYNFDNIYNSKNADKFDDKEGYPILESNNADNLSSPLFDEFFNNTNLKNNIDETNLKNDIDNTNNLNEDFDVESVDEDENDLPKNDAVLEVRMIPQYLSKVNNAKNLQYINKTYGLNINNQNLNVKSFKDKIKQKLMQLNPSIKESNIIVNLPADRLSDNQIAEGKKITRK